MVILNEAVLGITDPDLSTVNLETRKIQINRNVTEKINQLSKDNEGFKEVSPTITKEIEVPAPLNKTFNHESIVTSSTSSVYRQDAPDQTIHYTCCHVLLPLFRFGFVLYYSQSVLDLIDTFLVQTYHPPTIHRGFHRRGMPCQVSPMFHDQPACRFGTAHQASKARDQTESAKTNEKHRTRPPYW